MLTRDLTGEDWDSASSSGQDDKREKGLVERCHSLPLMIDAGQLSRVEESGQYYLPSTRTYAISSCHCGHYTRCVVAVSGDDGRRWKTEAKRALY